MKLIANDNGDWWTGDTGWGDKLYVIDVAALFEILKAQGEVQTGEEMFGLDKLERHILEHGEVVAI